MKQINKNEAKKQTLKGAKPNHGIENYYLKKLLTFSRTMNKSFKFWLRDLIADDTNEQGFFIRLKSDFDRLSDFWQQKAEQEANTLPYEVINKINNEIDNKNNAKNNFAVANTTSEAIQAILTARIDDNIALIKSIPQRDILRYKNIIFNNIQNFNRQGLSQNIKQINKELNEAQQIAEYEVKRIVRDQIKKATEQLNQQKAQNLGYEFYQWQTMNDDRVSGKPNGFYKGRPKVGGHWHLNGRFYRYDKATAIIDEKGNKGTCGERVNCRCISKPIYILPHQKMVLVRDEKHGDYYKLENKTADDLRKEKQEQEKQAQKAEQAQGGIFAKLKELLKRFRKKI